MLTPSQQLLEETQRFHEAVIEGDRPPRLAFLNFKEGTANLLLSPALAEDPVPTLLGEVLVKLSVSTYHEDHSVLRQLLRISTEILGQEVNVYAQAVTKRLLDKGDTKTALEWLTITGKMEELMVIDTLTQWHELLRLAAERRDEYIIGMCWKRMEQYTIGPTMETARMLVSALFHSSSSSGSRRPPTFESMKHVIKLLASSALPYDPVVSRLITGGYARAEAEELGTEVEQLYIASVPKRPGTLSEEQMHSKLAKATLSGERRHVNRLLREFLRLGLHPSEDTFLAVLGEDLSPANVKRWCEVLKIRPTARICTQVLEHLLQCGDGPPDQVVAFYRSQLRDGVRPSSDMLHLALQSLLTTGLVKPSAEAVDEALKIYREYISRRDLAARNETAQTEVVHDNPAPQPIDSTATRDESDYLDPPARRTYRLLLRTLTSKEHVVKRLPDAVMLVEDMQRYGIRVDRRLATSIIIILMRVSDTPTAALRLYRLISRPEVVHDEGPDGTKLTEDSYAAILHAFCTLPTWPHEVPSTRQYFEIVADMRKQGIPTTSKVYTIIIRQLAQLATSAAGQPDNDEESDTVRQMIAKTLARVHNQLTVNSEFTPDLPLWNQLMDAYQRAGCFAEACRVWQKLAASGMFNHASVSIIIDACAYNEAYDVAVRIYTTLMELEYPMNIRNWNTFLECLCRLDRLDEAMKVLCLEMTGRTDGVEPDHESVRILLKFAAKKNREIEVRSRVKRFLPKLYFSLPEDLRLGQP